MKRNLIFDFLEYGSIRFLSTVKVSDKFRGIDPGFQVWSEEFVVILNQDITVMSRVAPSPSLELRRVDFQRYKLSSC